MNRFLIRRALANIPTLFAVIVITFVIMHATPGGPWDQDLVERTARPGFEKVLDRKYGLDKPLFVNLEAFKEARASSSSPLDWIAALFDGQFGTYVWNLVQGDLGPSYRMQGLDVQDIMFAAEPGRPFWTSRFGTTALVGVLALIISVAVGLPFGIAAALRQNTFVDYASLFLATFFYGIPSFVLGVFFILFFAVQLDVMPVLTPPMWSTRNLPNLGAAFLPSLTLAVPSMAYLTRLTRASMLEVMHEDYVRTARAKGLLERVVVVRHIVRNGLVPVATVLGPMAAGLVTGSFIIESLFSINGIGRLYVEAVAQRDYPMIMGATLFFSFLVILANTAVDLVYGLLNPRMRVSG